MSETNKKLRGPFGESDKDVVALGSGAVNVVFSHAGQVVTVTGTGTQNISIASSGLKNGEAVCLAVKAVGGAAQLNVGSNSYRAANGTTTLYPHIFVTNGETSELYPVKALTAND